MKAELENLIDACRQVVRWADAPTPKGEFPHSFLERLKRMLNAGSLDEAGQISVLADIRKIVGDPQGQLMQDELVERVRQMAVREAICSALRAKELSREALWEGLHLGPFTVHESNTAHEENIFYILDSSNDAVVRTQSKAVAEAVCFVMNVARIKNKPEGNNK